MLCCLALFCLSFLIRAEVVDVVCSDGKIRLSLNGKVVVVSVCLFVYLFVYGCAASACLYDSGSDSNIFRHEMKRL
jgi:hypothetical protein